MVWIYALFSVMVVSLISFVGVFGLSLKEKQLQNLIIILLSFAIGGLFGDAFIHLIPESFAEANSGLLVSLLILLGIIIFFILEKFIRWRHCHLPTSEHHIHPVATINLVGDGVHNLIDGMLIGASFLVSIPLGLTTTLAVILHEIPQELGDFAILKHAGLPAQKILYYNFLSALAAVLGVIISLSIGERVGNYAAFLLPITAGGFIYIAGSDLLPELHEETDIDKSIKQLVAIITGIAVMALLVVLE